MKSVRDFNESVSLRTLTLPELFFLEAIGFGQATSSSSGQLFSQRRGAFLPSIVLRLGLCSGLCHAC